MGITCLLLWDGDEKLRNKTVEHIFVTNSLFRQEMLHDVAN